MSVQPVVGNLSTPFSQVLRLFTEFPVHHLPIVDDNNKLIGIVSSNDLPKIFLQLCNRAHKVTMDFAVLDKEITVSDLMTPNPVTITSDAAIADAAKIFGTYKFLAMPVVDKGILIGILSAKDVMKYISE